MNPTTHPTTTQDTTPGTGLSIRRLFTSAEKHPFDAVEWETRDARIGHGERIGLRPRGG